MPSLTLLSPSLSLNPLTATSTSTFSPLIPNVSSLPSVLASPMLVQLRSGLQDSVPILGLLFYASQIPFHFCSNFPYLRSSNQSHYHHLLFTTSITRPHSLPFQPFKPTSSSEDLAGLPSPPVRSHHLPHFPLPSFRYTRNLRNLLVSRSHHTLISTHSWSFLCSRPCYHTCSFITSITTLTGPNQYTLYCTSSALIYSIWCNLCNKLYVRQTDCRLADRVTEHTWDVSLRKNTPVTYRFRLVNHSPLRSYFLQLCSTPLIHQTLDTFWGSVTFLFYVPKVLSDTTQPHPLSDFSPHPIFFRHKAWNLRGSGHPIKSTPIYDLHLTGT